MTAFLIADTFADSLARLTGEEQKTVKTTAFDLQMDPSSPGLSFHRLDKAKDKRFWSVRVNVGQGQRPRTWAGRPDQGWAAGLLILRERLHCRGDWRQAPIVHRLFRSFVCRPIPGRSDRGTASDGSFASAD